MMSIKIKKKRKGNDQSSDNKKCEEIEWESSDSFAFDV